MLFDLDYGMLGLGGDVYLQSNLESHYPSTVNLNKLATKNLLIRGKFILEVDQSVPFGVLRVERIDEVKELSD